MNQVLERGVALPATPVEPYSCIMRHKHEQPEGEALAEAARSAFERVGEQWTDMRAQLFNVIVGLDRPASAYDIADRFSEQRGRRVAANSVYRILDLFVAANIVTRVEVANRYLPNVHPRLRSRLHPAFLRAVRQDHAFGRRQHCDKYPGCRNQCGVSANKAGDRSLRPM